MSDVSRNEMFDGLRERERLCFVCGSPDIYWRIVGKIRETGRWSFRQINVVCLKHTDAGPVIEQKLDNE